MHLENASGPDPKDAVVVDLVVPPDTRALGVELDELPPQPTSDTAASTEALDKRAGGIHPLYASNGFTRVARL
jgi:hypothetical protein